MFSVFFIFFFNDTATTEIYTLSLHDALPISKIKQLQKLERIEVETADISNINIKFPPCPHSGKIVLEAKNLTKKFYDNLVLNDIDFVLEKGEKVVNPPSDVAVSYSRKHQTSELVSCFKDVFEKR